MDKILLSEILKDPINAPTDINEQMRWLSSLSPEVIQAYKQKQLEEWQKEHALQEEEQKKASINVLLDMLPYFGDVKGGGEFFAGQNITGDELSWLERGAGLAGSLPMVPNFLSLFKAAKSLPKMAKALPQIMKTAVKSAPKTAPKVIEGTFTEPLPAGFGKRLNTLFNAPISRRNFIKEGAKVVKNKDNIAKSIANRIKESNNRIVYNVGTPYDQDIDSILEVGRLSPEELKKPGVWYAAVFGPEMFSLTESAKSMPWKEFKNISPRLQMPKSDLKTIWTLAQANLVDAASEYELLSALKARNLSEGYVKKSVLETIHRMRNEFDDFASEFAQRGGGGKPEGFDLKGFNWYFKTSPRDIIQNMRSGIERLGLSWDKLGNIKVNENRLGELRELAKKYLPEVVEGGTKVAGEIGTELGKTQMTRRGFLKGLGTLGEERGSFSNKPIEELPDNVYLHGVDDPREVLSILKSGGLKEGTSLSKTTGWDYPVSIEVETKTAPSAVMHHPDHFTSRGTSKIKKITIDRAEFRDIEKEIAMAEDQGDRIARKLENKGITDPHDPAFYTDPEFVRWSNKMDRLYTDQENMASYLKEKGWGSLESSLEELKAEAKKQGIAVVIKGEVTPSPTTKIQKPMRVSEDKAKQWTDKGWKVTGTGQTGSGLKYVTLEAPENKPLSVIQGGKKEITKEPQVKELESPTSKPFYKKGEEIIAPIDLRERKVTVVKDLGEGKVPGERDLIRVRFGDRELDVLRNETWRAEGLKEVKTKPSLEILEWKEKRGALTSNDRKWLDILRSERGSFSNKEIKDLIKSERKRPGTTRGTTLRTPTEPTTPKEPTKGKGWEVTTKKEEPKTGTLSKKNAARKLLQDIREALKSGKLSDILKDERGSWSNRPLTRLEHRFFPDFENWRGIFRKASKEVDADDWKYLPWKIKKEGETFYRIPADASREKDFRHLLDRLQELPSVLDTGGIDALQLIRHNPEGVFAYTPETVESFSPTVKRLIQSLLENNPGEFRKLSISPDVLKKALYADDYQAYILKNVLDKYLIK